MNTTACYHITLLSRGRYKCAHTNLCKGFSSWTSQSYVHVETLLVYEVNHLTMDYCMQVLESTVGAPPLVYAPPLFFHIERIGIVNAPPLIYPPPPSPSVLLPVISHPTLPPCIMKCQNVRDISRGTWPTRSI